MADTPGGYTEESGGQLQEKHTPEEQADKAIVDETIDNFTFARSYEDVQRRAETEELEFEGVDMWTVEARKDRDEHIDETTNRKVVSKPTLSVNLMDQSIQQTIAEARQARLALTVRPKAGLANTKTGDYIKGLVRSIQVESGSLSVRLWGLERTARVGRGGYRIAAEYATNGDFDIDLREERILDYGTVYWDPYSQRADRSDADWCVITDWMSERERKRKWPNKPIIPVAGAFEGEDHDWFATDADNKDQRRCRIATFYKVIHATHVLGYHPAVGPGWVGEPLPGSTLPSMADEHAAAVKKNAPGTRQRDVDARSVMIYIVDGSQVLEEHPWHGQFIPVIEIIGKEYFVKGKRRWKGKIANVMDLSRAINVLVSSATEIAGTMPRTPYIMYAGQDAGFEDMWDDAPVKNFTRLYVNKEDINGEPAPLPQRQQTELQIQGLLALLQMMHELFHAVDGSVAPQMAAVNPYDRSGTAIKALQQQGAAGTSNYLDNLATISMLYEGRVLLDAIPNYYDKVGRILRVVGEESDDETAIMLKVPFTRDKDGNPVPVPCPKCNGLGVVKAPGILGLFMAPQMCPVCQGSKVATRDNMPQEFNGQEVEYVDFGDGEYKIVAAVDRDYQTKQDEALQGMTQLAQSAPNLVPMYADLWVRAMGFSGSSEIADRIKSRMPEGDDDLKDLPPSLMGRFMQMQQQQQQTMAALEAAHKMLDTESIKTAGQKEIAMIRAAVGERLEKVKQQGAMLKVQQQGQQDGAFEVLRSRLEGMQQDSEFKHTLLLRKLDERQAIVMELLQELAKGATERHSTALHAEAANEAAAIADLHAARSDSRHETMAHNADVRQEVIAKNADARSGEAAAAERTATKEEPGL